MALSKKRKVKCQKSAREKKRKPSWRDTLIFPDMRQLALPQVGNEEDERPLSLIPLLALLASQDSERKTFVERSYSPPKVEEGFCFLSSI